MTHVYVLRLPKWKLFNVFEPEKYSFTQFFENRLGKILCECEYLAKALKSNLQNRTQKMKRSRQDKSELKGVWRWHTNKRTASKDTKSSGTYHLSLVLN